MRSVINISVTPRLIGDTRAVRYTITHKTVYEYDNEVSVSHHVVCLRPRELPNQKCVEHGLLVEPKPSVSNEHADYFGNHRTYLTVEGPHRQFAVTGQTTLEVLAAKPPDAAGTVPWEQIRDECRGDRVTASLAAIEFAFNSPLIRKRAEFAD